VTTLAIDVHDLAKSFGAVKVVDGLSMQVPEGEICGFLGGNGSGKTTTIRMLCGLLRPDAGGGTCLGFDLLREPMRIREQIGYMTQRFSFYDDLTVAQNLEFVARLYQLPDRDRAIAEVLQRMDMEVRAGQLARELSGGWKQRLALAACVLRRPRLLLLDEPTAGMSPEETRTMMDLIVKLAGERTVILVEHKMKLVLGISDRILVLHHGELLAEGSPAEVRKNEAVKRVYLGQREH
jgi:ABC-type multidrug transport system ATPase subunit